MRKIYLLVIFCCLSISGYSTVWYSVTAGGVVTTLTNWNSLPAGGGSTPANFTTAGDTWIIQSAMTVAAATWTIAGSLDVITGGTFNKTGATVTTINIGDSLTLSGSCTVSTGAAAANASIYVGGNLTVTGTAKIITGAAGIYFYIYLNNASSSLANPQYIYWTSTGASLRTALTVVSGCTAQLESAIPLPQNSDIGETINGTLVCGTYAMSSASTDVFTVNAGASFYTANTAGINGSVTLMSGTNFSSAANYIYNGTLAQVTGTYLPATITAAGSVTVDNSTGVTLSQTTTIGSGATLTLTSGNLTIGADNLVLGPTSTLAGTFSNAAMIIASSTGLVEEQMSANGSFLYPVGDAVPNYTPITLNFTSGTYAGGAYAGVNLSNVKDPNNANVTNYLNRYWSITTSGISAPVYAVTAATYVPGDVVGTESLISMGEYTGALPWIKFGPTNIATHTLTSSAVSNVSSVFTGISTAGPTVTSAAGSAVCAGNSTSLSVVSSTGDPTLTYSWAPATGLSATTGTSVTAAPTTTTPYTVTVTDGNGFTSTSTSTVTINPTPTAILGTESVCIGSITSLSDALSGGTWASTSSNASIGSLTGIVTGNTVGTATISYDLGGCYASAIVTVNAPPTAITGSATFVCTGNSITLGDGTSGGAWTSSASATASVGTSGIVNGNLAGTAIITYTTASCPPVTYPITVNPYPGAINGPVSVCIGSTITLTDITAGGIWTSSVPDSAAIVSTTATTATVMGDTTGPAIIYYNLTGCVVSYAITVDTLPAAITGSDIVCLGSTTTLADITTGGTWSSNNALVASVGSGTGMVTGNEIGATYITYTNTSTGCYVTMSETVDAHPSAISGPNSVCLGATVHLIDVSPGGTWSSSLPGIGSVGSISGIVTGVALGTTTITYSIVSGCSVTETMTVNPNPAAITGSSLVCLGSTITLTTTTTGGTWSSAEYWIASVGSSSGVVSGLTAGSSATISYILGTGCFSTFIDTVQTPPSMIMGDSTICVTFGSVLSDSVTGGSWSSSAPGSLTINDIGSMYAVFQGIVAITYSVAGCPSVSHNVTVNPIPAGIVGPSTFCDSIHVDLYDTSTGGIWSSNDSITARVISYADSGVAVGVSLGTTFISYTLPTGCYVLFAVTVNPLAPPISGTDTICSTGSAWLTDIVDTGIWTSSNPAVATINDSGYLTGIVPGVTFIVYTLPTGCSAFLLETVIPAIPAILGPSQVCSGSIINMTDADSGGVWSSTNDWIAEFIDTGALSGRYHGTVTISYTVSAFKGCYATTSVVVNPLPAPLITFNYTIPSVSTYLYYTSYQWYNDRTGIIPGAINATYVLPDYNDSVYVVVTDTNGCTDSTSWFYNDFTGIKNVSSVYVSIYPNPATSTLYIESNVAVRAVITAIDGETVMEQANAKEMNINTLTPGMYMVTLYNDEGQIIKIEKVVKE